MAEKKEINIRTSYDEMEAYLRLTSPPVDEKYFKQEILEALAQKGIKVGIDEQIIEQMLAQNSYGREYVIARGTPAEDGKDAFFQYNFDLNLNNKPTIRPDGTVDYRSVHAIEVVEEGQVIAVYHEPIDGHHGMTVTGKVITSKRGRPLSPLRGKGFERAEDGIHYIASLTGKIEMSNDRIVILPVYEVNGNVDLQTGNVDFRGDVLVHGNVCPGAVIRATGTVTVEGTVEACIIEAGKDVVLKAGFLGGNRGVLRTKGNLIAKFMEYATIETEGYIEASSALNCRISCNDHVFIRGKKANIVGGVVYGASGVDAQNIGSEAEVNTYVKTGVSRELMEQIVSAQNTITELESIIAKVNMGIKQLEMMAAEKNIDIQKDERRVTLLRTRIAKQAELSQAKEKLSHDETIREKCKGAGVRVLNKIYPGSIVEINSCPHRVNDMQNAIDFVEYKGNVIMMGLDEGIVE